MFSWFDDDMLYLYNVYIYIIYGFLIMNIVMFYVWGAPSIINPG